MVNAFGTAKKLIPAKIRAKLKPFYLKWSLRHFRRPEVVFITRHGFHIKLDPINRAVDEYVFIHRNWEPDIAAVIQAKLKPGNVFVDVGANIGYFSMLSASIVGKRGKVISFEPIKRLAEQIRFSADYNHFKNIDIENLAMGSIPAVMTLEIMPGNVGGSSLVKQINSGQSEVVNVSTLDEELKNYDRIDLIKIDVEGYEFQVLKGAENIIKSCKPEIILEFSPSVYAKQKVNNTKKILELIISLNYSIQDLNYGYPCLNINEYISDLGLKQTNLLLTYKK